MTDKPILLVLTVGGSPQPLASALKALTPDIVVFLPSSATKKLDGKPGTPSSRNQVEDDLIEYDSKTKAQGPGLKFANGCPPPDHTQIFEIPPDDPDKAYSLCRTHLTALARSHPDHQIIADYTGGTKSMTGALLMAAFAQDKVQVQFMLGDRTDLTQIEGGTERPQVMQPDFVLAERDIEKALQSVSQFDYLAASNVAFDLQLKIGLDAHFAATMNAPLAAFTTWTRVLADWDAFRHREAWNRLAPWSKSSITAPISWLKQTQHYVFLKNIFELGQSPPPTYLLCADLWLNALRRGEQGRYDDAIQRLYRVVEAVAQAKLFEIDGVLTATVPISDLSEDLHQKLHPNPLAKTVQLSLSDNVAHLATRNGGTEISRAIKSHLDPRSKKLRLPSWLESRNHSILAHGFIPIKEKTWKEARDWVQTHLRPFWQAYEPPQLPTKLPSF